MDRSEGNGNGSARFVKRIEVVEARKMRLGVARRRGISTPCVSDGYAEKNPGEDGYFVQIEGREGVWFTARWFERWYVEVDEAEVGELAGTAVGRKCGV